MRRWSHREIGRHESHQSASTTLVIIGGIHGNEPAGLIAASRVLETLEQEQPAQFDGRLVVLAGNLPALNHRDPSTRYIDFDLNRIWTDEQIAKDPSRSAEHAQMHELLASLRAIRAQGDRMIVMDLHTTSSDAPPVIVLEDSIPARKFARQMPLPIYLGFEEELRGLMIDRITNELGSIAIVVEGGQHADPRSILVHESVIWAGLHAAGILRVDSMRYAQSPGEMLRAAVKDEAHKVYDIRYLKPIEHESFTIAPGIVAGTRIKQGVTPIAIENGAAVFSPVKGRVFLPNMQEQRRVGDDGFFIVRHVSEGWLGLSARLRMQDWIHWIIAHLPGVHQIDEDTLCIDANISRVLKRQLFHLFGYRLVRHDQRDGGRGFYRLWHGARSFFKAFIRGPIPGGPEIDDPRFWIVRRHALDQSAVKTESETR